jgi:hypothetical protein
MENSYTLSPEESAYFAEFGKALDNFRQELERQASAAVRLIRCQRGLQGDNWRLEGNTLVRQDG